MPEGLGRFVTLKVVSKTKNNGTVMVFQPTFLGKRVHFHTKTFDRAKGFLKTIYLQKMRVGEVWRHK